MPPQNPVTTTEQKCLWYQPLCKVTPLSKYLAFIIFILLPFVGAYIGYQLAPEKIVEVSIPVNIVQKPITDVSMATTAPDQISVASTTDVVESSSSLRLYFDSDPEIPNKLMTGVLNIALKDSAAIKTIDVTGYTLESTKTGKIFTFNKVALEGSKYKACSPIKSGPSPLHFDEGMGNIITIATNSTDADCLHEGEGLVIYTLHSVGSVWNTTGDTIELRNLEGSVVTSYTF